MSTTAVSTGTNALATITITEAERELRNLLHEARAMAHGGHHRSAAGFLELAATILSEAAATQRDLAQPNDRPHVWKVDA